MRMILVFVKGLREQVREFWILVMTVVMAPLFIGIYFLMSGTGEWSSKVIIVNLDRGYRLAGVEINLGDSLHAYLEALEALAAYKNLDFVGGADRDQALTDLKKGRADVLLVVPEGLSEDFSNKVGGRASGVPELELAGDVTSMGYMFGAVWTSELVNDWLLKASGRTPPVSWKETTLGHSGSRSEFELYVPGLLILSIIMIIFSTSAAIVREAETRTLERLKISRLSALEYLTGLSLVQFLIALVSLWLALLTALALGYGLLPGTLGFLMLISMLTAMSMIAFSLLVAAMCRSVKEVAIIGTFPLFLLMFFTGAAFPISGGRLFSIGEQSVMINHVLSPTWSVQALNKVLVLGLEGKDCLGEILAIILLTGFYFLSGTWAFRRRHMRAA